MIAAVVWVLVGGTGLLVLLTAQPVGRARPSLADRLERLRPDLLPAEPDARVFSAPGLDATLLPVLRALGEIVLRIAGPLGIDPGRLARRLELAGEPGGAGVFYGQKLAGALVGLAFLPTLNLAGVAPFGSWPAWMWLAAAALGFIAPDLGLRGKVARRRRELLTGTGVATEFLALAVSAGSGLEQALAETAAAGTGPLFDELSTRLARAHLEGRRGVDAVRELAGAVDIPELTALAGALEASAYQGTPVLQTLRAQATASRERRRIALLEAGEKAQVTMLLPVGLLILPAFFLVILFPAAVALLRLSSP